MPVKKLKAFLDSNGVKYVTIGHSAAFTAQEIAASAHIPGKELAKTVMVDLDGRLAMAVLPASLKVDLDRLQKVAGAANANLADESQFASLFSGCEVGAMPPFGNLYDMDVYVSQRLAEDEEIAFNSGSHTELIRLAYADFDRLVNPKVAKIGYGE
ncbi:MAG: YbaK/EbsC family protein [Patescibacteria group bacterium]|nr:YbaK/EbsC family protein [Patescibacteria group bacterium]